MLKSAILVLALVPALALGQANDALRAQVEREKQPLLDTLRSLVEIESGSGDVEGIARIGRLVGDRLKTLGGAVDFVAPAADMPRFLNTPAQLGDTVVARF